MSDSSRGTLDGDGCTQIEETRKARDQLVLAHHRQLQLPRKGVVRSGSDGEFRTDVGSGCC